MNDEEFQAKLIQLQKEDSLLATREAYEGYAEECAKDDEHRAPVLQGISTLRDDFAKAALTGLLSRETSPRTSAEWASWAYEIAAAMLSEREKWSK